MRLLKFVRNWKFTVLDISTLRIKCGEFFVLFVYKVTILNLGIC